MDRRRCGLIEGDAGRDSNAAVRRMDRTGRLRVAISVAQSDVWQAPARPRAHVQGPSLLFMYTSSLGAQAAQVVGLGAWAVGELIGAVCEGHGRELGCHIGTKTASGAQCA